MTKRYLLAVCVCLIACLTAVSKRAYLQTERITPLKDEMLTKTNQRFNPAVAIPFVVDSSVKSFVRHDVEKDSKPMPVLVRQRREISTQAAAQVAPQELFAHDDVQGSIGLLPYERIQGRGVRFRYEAIEQERIGHVWFVKKRDLRGKTLRISYSGMVPRETTFKLARSGNSAAFTRQFLLEDSSRTKTLSLEVPATLPFREVSHFEFEIERSKAGRPYGDFLIEKVEILDREATAPSPALEKNTPFPFGDPFLQPNIWGGEAPA